jgi:hypothetical protein
MGGAALYAGARVSAKVAWAVGIALPLVLLAGVALAAGKRRNGPRSVSLEAGREYQWRVTTALDPTVAAGMLTAAGAVVSDVPHGASGALVFHASSPIDAVVSVPGEVSLFGFTMRLASVAPVDAV